MLSSIHSQQRAFFDAQLAAFQAVLAGEGSDPAEVENGLLFGRTVAQAILGQRAHDGAVRSDEFDGTTTDAAGNVRPEVTRIFTSIEEIVTQNPESRVFLGVHWHFDGVGGRETGTKAGGRAAERVYVLPPSV